MGQFLNFERSYILHDEDIVGNLEPQHFDPVYWREGSKTEAVFGGRGGSLKIDLQGQAAILRRYLRGGMMASVSTDSYLWTGKLKTRPWREWSILKQALERDLPVPQPLGIYVRRTGLLYRAAIITAWIDDTETLAARLMRQPLNRETWVELGLLLQKFQELGFRHADLNANNLLINQQDQLFIIDFDKAERMKSLQDWQWLTLRRLQRSLDKIDHQHQLHYRSSDWQALIDGYQSKDRDLSR
jgi:3-deoxy-D-manno-octulosonic acid kinase